MATRPQLTTAGSPVLVRLANPESNQLWDLLFRRYPAEEWGTFIRLGWAETRRGLVLTLAGIDPPRDGDLDEDLPIVRFRDQYIVRTTLAAEKDALAVGVVHSHPEGYLTRPSLTDDDMDGYFARHFGDFLPNRPYVSLIFAKDGEQMSGTGRVFWKGAWHRVERFSLLGTPIAIEGYELPSLLSPAAEARVARLRSSFGEEAAEALARATVGVLGFGGTGSPGFEAIVRAGVGFPISVDPEHFDDSNIERMHGSSARDLEARPPKAAIAVRLAQEIDPARPVCAIKGALPQREVLEELLWADVVIGCTDQHSSRLALSELSYRYLVPVIDCGANMEGQDGKVTGQPIQLVRFLPDDPCALCRDMIAWPRVQQELMGKEEQLRRQEAAEQAVAQGRDGDQYWRRIPQLNTVGYLTTIAGAMAAGYAVGWITARFDPPFSKLQFNLSQPLLDINDFDMPPDQECQCRSLRGHADQAASQTLVTVPSHWAPAEFLSRFEDWPTVSPKPPVLLL